MQKFSLKCLKTTNFNRSRSRSVRDRGHVIKVLNHIIFLVFLLKFLFLYKTSTCTFLMNSEKVHNAKHPMENVLRIKRQFFWN